MNPPTEEELDRIMENLLKLEEELKELGYTVELGDQDEPTDMITVRIAKTEQKFPNLFTMQMQGLKESWITYLQDKDTLTIHKKK